MARLEDFPPAVRAQVERQLARDPAKVEQSAAAFDDATFHLSDEGKAEKVLQHEAIKWLEAHGWIILYHARTDRPTTAKKGVADILALRRDGLFLAAEAKVGNNKASKEQRDYLAAVALHGGIACVFYSISELRAVIERLTP